MQCLSANKETFHFANLVGMIDAVDDSGYKTGEKIASYTAPTEKEHTSPLNTAVYMSILTE